MRRLVALVVLMLAVPVAGAPAATTPACFGAAARDPEIPCVNRALNFTAIPSPFDAPLEPSAPCRPIRAARPQVCAFGVPADKATDTVALIGDSHAVHWRAALAVVAANNRWHGVTIARGNCPFTAARSTAKGRCGGWTTSVLRWLKQHPEIHTVVVSANSGSGVIPARGITRGQTKIAGYIRAWKALRRNVRDIFVIRDVPHSRTDTPPCVARNVARHRNPAVRCALRRSAALRDDLEAVAAEQTNSERVKLIDLTPFMCDTKRCFPVVGGALVIKDVGHLTRTFSRSLGPYLGRAITRLRTP